MRLHRKRRRNGLRYARLLVPPEWIDVLVRKRVMSEERRDDAAAIERALEIFLDHTLDKAGT